CGGVGGGGGKVGREKLFSRCDVDGAELGVAAGDEGFAIDDAGGGIHTVAGLAPPDFGALGVEAEDFCAVGAENYFVVGEIGGRVDGCAGVDGPEVFAVID